jgi:hypothetical protein
VPSRGAILLYSLDRQKIIQFPNKNAFSAPKLDSFPVAFPMPKKCATGVGQAAVRQWRCHGRQFRKQAPTVAVPAGPEPVVPLILDCARAISHFCNENVSQRKQIFGSISGV